MAYMVGATEGHGPVVVRAHGAAHVVARMVGLDMANNCAPERGGTGTGTDPVEVCGVVAGHVLSARPFFIRVDGHDSHLSPLDHRPENLPAPGLGLANEGLSHVWVHALQLVDAK